MSKSGAARRLKLFLKKWRAKLDIWRVVGILGTLACAGFFIHAPSFPTPDKLFVFLVFAAMAFGQAWDFIKHFLPFVALLLVYESFRGLVPSLNAHVNYLWMPGADRALFGGLPTAWLQYYLWHGYVTWYDFVFYGAYTLHFVLPFALALLVWKLRESEYWRFITTYLIASFAGFLTFLLFPAAPPWLASDNRYIQPIAHVSSSIWAAFGIHDFPSVYNKIAPNPVAAVPSLHATYAVLLFIFTWKFFGKKWAAVAALYPLLIFFGTVYMGEHYAIDEIIGIAYGIGAYFLTIWLFKYVFPHIRHAWQHRTSR